MNRILFEKTLGYGASAVVKQARIGAKKFAVKIIDLSKISIKDAKKEIKIHKMLNHKNIIKLYSARIFLKGGDTSNRKTDDMEDNNPNDHGQNHVSEYDSKNLGLYNCYLIMQLADNELFYFIEPGIGIGSENVHFYFKQLMDAVFYLHSKNICHRDIKPENILLDRNCNLLLTDFGHSTILKDRNGCDRIMMRIAGSRAYMAPEISRGAYKGDEVDIWSSGIVLFVLSAGRLPWQDPDYHDPEFDAFFRLSRHNYAPWSDLDPRVLRLFEGMCALKNRFGKEHIESNEWFRQQSVKTKLFKHKVISFSQPKQRISSPTESFVSSQPNSLKFRRVYVSDSETGVFMNIQEILQKMSVKFNASKDNNFVVSYETVDRKGQPLAGEFCIKRIDDMVSVSINRLRGDSLEFKRFCNAVFDRLRGYR